MTLRTKTLTAVAALTLSPVLSPAMAADEPVAAPVGEQALIVSPVAWVSTPITLLMRSTLVAFLPVMRTTVSSRSRL